MSDDGLMRRWVIDRYGRENLRIDTVPIPAPKETEIRVRVTAVALNPRDLMMINHGMGLDVTFPFVPSSDMAGVVEAIGTNVTRFSVGDRVIANFMPERLEGRPGGSARHPSYQSLGGYYAGVLSEEVCVPESWLVPAPFTLSDAEAATLPVAGLTAWFALVEQGRVKAGEIVLVPGTGGVALFAVQIAAAHGAKVIVTSSDKTKLARVMALGASHIIDRSSENMAAAVDQITDGAGVDHVLDLIGGDNFALSIAAVAPGGRVSVIGLRGDGELHAPTVPVLLKAPVIQGIVTGHRRALCDLVRAVDRLKLKPVIDGLYDFDSLPQALEHLERGAFGKVVVNVETGRA